MINTNIIEDDGEQVALKTDFVSLKISSKSDTSEDDFNRKELLWERREEELILGWCKRLKSSSIAHGKMGKVMKQRYTMVSLPAILIPVVASSLSTVLQPYPLAMTGAMLATSIFTGINGFFNYGKKISTMTITKLQ